MSDFDPSAFGPVLSEILEMDRGRELGPGSPKSSSLDVLNGLSVETAFAHTSVVDGDMAACCLSGIWLLCDYLDESHAISQSVESGTGSYWHAIMHRREQDYSNAKYWFRRVDGHPVFEPLHEEAQRLASDMTTDDPAVYLKAQTHWDPFLFVDLCEKVALGQSRADALCREIARREWELLFEYSYRAATGG